MNFVDTLKRSSRNLRHAKLRTLLTASAIAVGGFTLTLTLAATTGARQYADKIIQANIDPNSIMVAKDNSLFGGNTSSKPREYDPSLGNAYGLTIKQLSQKDIEKIKAVPGVGDVLENYDLTAQYITRPGAKKYTGRLNVYDPKQKPPMLAAGQFPDTLADGAALLPEGYVSLLGFDSAGDAIGEKITVQMQQLTGANEAREFEIAGVIGQSPLTVDPSGGTPPVLVSQKDARQLNSFVNAGTTNADKVPTVIVRSDGTDPALIKERLLFSGFVAYTSADLQQFINQIISVLQGIVLVFGLITLIASFFGVVNTQYISVLERTREIGLMKALGMSRGAVSLLFIVEATWIGFLGALLGSLFAVLVGTALNPWISEILNFDEQRLLIFSPVQIAGLIVFLMLVTTIAGLLPARKAAKLDPIDALRTE